MNLTSRQIRLTYFLFALLLDLLSLHHVTYDCRGQHIKDRLLCYMKNKNMLIHLMDARCTLMNHLMYLMLSLVQGHYKNVKGNWILIFKHNSCVHNGSLLEVDCLLTAVDCTGRYYQHFQVSTDCFYLMSMSISQVSKCCDCIKISWLKFY